MTAIRKSKQPNAPPQGEPWVWLSAALLASPAWRSMSVNARRALDRLMLEHMAHGGKENGKLQVTHRDFIEAGVSRDFVADAIDELEHLRLIRITSRGRGGTGITHANRFLLTWMPEKGSRFCDDPWKSTDQARVGEWQVLRKKLKRRRANASHKQSRDGVKNHFPTPQMRTAPLRKCGVDLPDMDIESASKRHIPTPQMRSTSNILEGNPPDTEPLQHVSALVPVGWSHPTAQARPAQETTSNPSDTKKSHHGISGAKP